MKKNDYRTQILQILYEHEIIDKELYEKCKHEYIQSLPSDKQQMINNELYMKCSSSSSYIHEALSSGIQTFYNTYEEYTKYHDDLNSWFKNMLDESTAWNDKDKEKQAKSLKMDVEGLDDDLKIVREKLIDLFDNIDNILRVDELTDTELKDLKVSVKAGYNTLNTMERMIELQKNRINTNINVTDTTIWYTTKDSYLKSINDITKPFSKIIRNTDKLITQLDIDMDNVNDWIV